MSIRIAQDHDHTYRVNIHDRAIKTTLGILYKEVEKWVKEMEKLYLRRKTNQSVVVGIHTKSKPYSEILDVLAICVEGKHCLVMPHVTAPPDSLMRFLSDHRVEVVGVGTVNMTRKLKEENGFKIPMPMEISYLAERAKGLGRGEFGTYDVMRLAEEVFGKEMEDVVNPTNVEWWKDGYVFSDNEVKCATVEAFLTFALGAKLLKNGHY